jgi:hypothetical protein
MSYSSTEVSRCGGRVVPGHFLELLHLSRAESGAEDLHVVGVAGEVVDLFDVELRPADLEVPGRDRPPLRRTTPRAVRFTCGYDPYGQGGASLGST